MRQGPKHTLCRRLGSCIWGNPKCPSAKRPFPAGQHGNVKGGRRGKLSTYGQLLLEKQKLRAHYALSEHQLEYLFAKAKKAMGQTGENLLRILETRLASIIYRSGLAPSIFAARQIVLHRHVRVNGEVVNRSSFPVKSGSVVSIDPQRSAAIAAAAQKTDIVPPPYLELDKESCKVTLARLPLAEEIPANVNIMKVVEYYAR
ncbi:MAG: 30S ribosomal protein S4 [Lentisphaeria bacterium]